MRTRRAIWAGALLVNALLAVAIVVRVNGLDTSCTDDQYIFGACDIAYIAWTGVLLVVWLALGIGLLLFWWMGRRTRT